MGKIRYSFITTVFNEEKTIQKFLSSILLQTKNPEELIIVDSFSTDKTIEIIKSFEKKFSSKNIKLKFFLKKGNRSVGRNEAIKRAIGEIILCSDAGCILDAKWIEEITKPFENSDVDVVAGYYKGFCNTVFQQCLVPYVLVMPDKINPKTFLPATRSMAFRKSIWIKLDKFDEKLSHNEDYAFAKKLQKTGKKIVFCKNAIAFWIPRDSIKEAFVMFYKFAKGDMEAGIIRFKVLFLFIRYAIALFILVLIALTKDPKIMFVLVALIFLYLYWAIIKNYRYVKKSKALFVLPVLQLTADLAVISGSIIGLLNHFKFWKRKNKMPSTF